MTSKEKTDVTESTIEKTGINIYYSRFAFMFIVFIVITSGSIREILSCQMQYFIETSLYTRHILAIILLFVFIMMEGGWSFDFENDSSQSNNWSSGHVVHSMIMSIAIYALFLISSKSKLVPNLIFFGILFSLYLINTQRSYMFVRKEISQQTNKVVLYSETLLAVIALIVLMYGFMDYIVYQKTSYGNGFKWKLFMFGTQKCTSLASIKND